MTKTLVFVAYGFSKDNARLQPWRYIFELAKHKSKKNKVIVVTGGAADRSETIWEKNLTVIETRFLRVRNQKALGDLLKSLDPQELWWSTTPRTIGFYPLLSKINYPKIAFITCPLYTWSEMIRASVTGVPFKETKALWKQRLMPRFLFRKMLNSEIFNQIIVQSQGNKNILEKMNVEETKVNLIPVGIDKEDVESVDEKTLSTIRKQINIKKTETLYLYLGALRTIRGFDALSQVFPDVVKRDDSIRLMVLARGADEGFCQEVRTDFANQGVTDNVSIVGGWLSREEVWAYIELSDVVVLPFVLVPSDIPIAVLEALARGKPVIVSSVDGLPEMAKGRGIIVDPLNKKEFSDAMLELGNNVQRRKQLGKAAYEYMQKYPRWSEVGEMLDSLPLENSEN
jgi:glycosyltransferase involved in cell wall biosynthesis